MAPQALALPPLPLDEWRPSKDTLHLWLQIVGKVRMALMPPQNHWWHVTHYVTPRGLTTGAIPYHGGSFEVRFDLLDHQLFVCTSSGPARAFALRDGLAVAEFHESLFRSLGEVGISATIRARPYDTMSTIPFAEDRVHASYEAERVQRFWRALVAVDGVLEEFRGRFVGKSTPVHVFWHSFDLAHTRFSGREAPPLPEANRVTQEAYSHEVVSFGFWAGDQRFPFPAFYSYTAPEPPGLAARPLASGASWVPAGAGSSLAILRYDDLREAADPRQALLEFLESAYQAGATGAGWDVERLASRAWRAAGRAGR